MYVLKFCDWEFGDTHLKVLKAIPENMEKEKDLIVLCTDMQIRKYQFGAGLMNARFFRQQISGSNFHTIEKMYREWRE